jgi:hypothetical protein
MKNVSILFSIFLFVACSVDAGRDNKKTQSESEIAKPIDIDDKNIPEETKEDLSLSDTDLRASKFCVKQKPSDDLPKMKEYFSSEFISEKLQFDGLTGWIHGAAPRFGYYVFTYRSEDESDPMSFFKAEEFSLITKDPTVRNSLLSLRRHDKIRIFGKIKKTRSPLRHLEIESVEVLEDYEKSSEYNHKASLDLKNGDTALLFGKIHTVIADGKALVFEYKDIILPVFLTPDQYGLTRNTFRNDKVLLSVKAVSFGNRPAHLYLNGVTDNPLKVVNRMQDCHGSSTKLTGLLTRFEKSPQINRNIYAIKIVDKNGVERNFTLFPNVDFNDPTTNPNDRFRKLFMEISSKVEKAWNSEIDSISPSRNHSFNAKITIRAKGIMNIVSKTQANPQIYISDADDIEVEIK